MALECSIQKKLQHFSLQVAFEKKEEQLGILGASGDGKSMTLKCIAGIEKPDRGRIVLNGRVLFDSKQKIDLPPQKRKVGYLFQNYALFPNMTIEENIGISLTGTKEEKRNIVAKQIKNYHLEGLEKSYPQTISGGQQQRVALARMMAFQPELIMLDEPFSALDSYLKDVLQEQLLESLSDYQGDVMMVSHNRDEIYRFCEKLIIFSKGKSLLVGDTREVFRNPQKEEAARLTGCKNISPIKKINNTTLYCQKWNVTLRTNQTIRDEIRFVGIRAHSLVPAEEGRETNTIPARIHTKAEMPFEVHFKLKTDSSELWWYISKTRLEKELGSKIPQYLYFPPEALMLLT